MLADSNCGFGDIGSNCSENTALIIPDFSKDPHQSVIGSTSSMLFAKAFNINKVLSVKL